MSERLDPWGAPDDRPDAQVIQELTRELRLRNEWIRQNRAEVKAARERVHELEALVAGLVTTYGEFVSTGHKRAAVAGTCLERVAGAHLSVHMDPVSGSVLLHVREG